MTRAAYLRIYVPADPADQSTREYVEPALGVARTLRSGKFGLLAEPLDDDGFMIEWRDEHYVCPRTARLRMLQGVVAYHAAYRHMGGALIIPEATARVAADELDRLFTERPETRSHILTSAWHVPSRWFLGFHADEKEIVDDRSSLGVRFRAAIEPATRRIRRALAAVESAGFDESITGDIAELLDWVESFPRNAMLELDYGTSALFFSDSDLVLDDSCELIWMSVQALERGDYLEAQQHYFELVGRWHHAMTIGQHS